jgi:hypothetical protein
VVKIQTSQKNLKNSQKIKNTNLSLLFKYELILSNNGPLNWHVKIYPKNCQTVLWKFRQLRAPPSASSKAATPVSSSRRQPRASDALARGGLQPRAPTDAASGAPPVASACASSRGPQLGFMRAPPAADTGGRSVASSSVDLRVHLQPPAIATVRECGGSCSCVRAVRPSHHRFLFSFSLTWPLPFLCVRTVYVLHSMYASIIAGILFGND